MRRIAVLAVLAAGAAEAQTVPVRTGEHDGFTRVVLASPNLGGWSLDPAPGGFEVALPGIERFVVDGVFDRLSQGRVASVEPAGDGRLVLGIGCDCYAEAGILAGVGLVIDVRDGPVPAGGLAPGPRVTASRATDGPVRALVPPTDPTSRPPAPGPAASSGPVPQLPLGTDSALAQGVASAVSHGLLDIVPGERQVALAPPPAADAPPPSEPPLSEPPPSPEPPAALPATPGLAFRTGQDLSSGPRIPLAAGGTPCLPADAFDLASWAGTGSLADELAKRTADLTDARDRLDSDAVEALARTYLAFGLGREAGLALDLDGRASRERDRLRLVGLLVDGEAVEPSALDDQAACLGPVALWRALARGSVRGLDDDERAAVAVAVRDLPPAIRGPVALRIADLHLADGDPAAASEAAALAARSGTDTRLAEARAALGEQRATQALEGYGDLIDQDAHPSPDAMVELIDLSIAEGRPVPSPTLDLLRALRAEHGGASARMLLLAESRALAAQDRFGEAVALLEEERSEHPGADLDATLETAVLALVERASDAGFLELALGGLPADLPSGSRAAVGARLDALGFVEEARALGHPTDPLAAETPRPAVPLASAGLEPEVAAAPDPATLAARRDLLERAQEAKGRAEALLRGTPVATGP